MGTLLVSAVCLLVFEALATVPEAIVPKAIEPEAFYLVEQIGGVVATEHPWVLAFEPKVASEPVVSGTVVFAEGFSTVEFSLVQVWVFPSSIMVGLPWSVRASDLLPSWLAVMLSHALS